MKRIVLLISLVAAFSLCVGAQTLIDFSKMPMVSAPAPMPDYYPTGMGLYWDNFHYVTPGAWSGEGAGFRVGPKVNDVVFVGGPMCSYKTPCTAMIKMNPIVAVLKNQTFTPISILLSAGWQDNYVRVTAYNNGTYVGTLLLKATTTPRVFTFPAAWRVTQLVFTPDFPGNTAFQGSAVIYNFIIMQNH